MAVKRYFRSLLTILLVQFLHGYHVTEQEKAYQKVVSYFTQAVDSDFVFAIDVSRNIDDSLDWIKSLLNTSASCMRSMKHYNNDMAVVLFAGETTVKANFGDDCMNEECLKKIIDDIKEQNDSRRIELALRQAKLLLKEKKRNAEKVQGVGTYNRTQAIVLLAFGSENGISSDTLSTDKDLKAVQVSKQAKVSPVPRIFKRSIEEKKKSPSIYKEGMRQMESMLMASKVFKHRNLKREDIASMMMASRLFKDENTATGGDSEISSKSKKGNPLVLAAMKLFNRSINGIDLSPLIRNAAVKNNKTDMAIDAEFISSERDNSKGNILDTSETIEANNRKKQMAFHTKSKMHTKQEIGKYEIPAASQILDSGIDLIVIALGKNAKGNEQFFHNLVKQRRRRNSLSRIPSGKGLVYVSAYLKFSFESMITFIMYTCLP